MNDFEIATEIDSDSSEDTIYQRTINGKRYQMTPEAIQLVETTTSATKRLSERFSVSIIYPDGTVRVVK